MLSASRSTPLGAHALHRRSDRGDPRGGRCGPGHGFARDRSAARSGWASLACSRRSTRRSLTGKGSSNGSSGGSTRCTAVRWPTTQPCSSWVGGRARPRAASAPRRWRTPTSGRSDGRDARGAGASATADDARATPTEDVGLDARPTSARRAPRCAVGSVACSRCPRPSCSPSS
ncbi:hypothetical protein NKG05_00450 [Oerskovia sp. M15]